MIDFNSHCTQQQRICTYWGSPYSSLSLICIVKRQLFMTASNATSSPLLTCHSNEITMMHLNILLSKVRQLILWYTKSLTPTLPHAHPHTPKMLQFCWPDIKVEQKNQAGQSYFPWMICFFLYCETLFWLFWSPYYFDIHCLQMEFKHSQVTHLMSNRNKDSSLIWT